MWLFILIPTCHSSGTQNNHCGSKLRHIYEHANTSLRFQLHHQMDCIPSLHLINLLCSFLLFLLFKILLCSSSSSFFIFILNRYSVMELQTRPIVAMATGECLPASPLPRLVDSLDAERCAKDVEVAAVHQEL